MGAKESKTASQYSEKSHAQDDSAKLYDKQQIRTQQTRQRQKLVSKLSADAEEFTPIGKENVSAEAAKYNKYPDAPWVQFLQQKERERPSRCKGQIPRAPPKQPILLQTGEYLKLLKSTENRTQKAIKPLVAGGTKKTDIAAAVDAIIQARCKQEKPPSSITSTNEKALLHNLVQLFNLNPEIRKVAGSPKADRVASAKDDIMLEKLNSDEVLADPVYWSEDERAPILPRLGCLASAHRLGRRPRNDPPFLREYVMQDLDSQLDKEVAKLLLSADRLNKRHKTFKTQARYINTGIKEVLRAVKSGKVKCVVIAPDIDSTCNGGVDAQIRDIVGSAYKKDVPVVFALSRARIGMAFGKSLKVSVVGLHETKGIHEQFENVLSLAYQQRVSWMERELPRSESRSP